MKIVDAFNKFWNSKAFETIVDITYESTKILGNAAVCLGDIIVEAVMHSPSDNKIDIYQETYDYWMSLSYEDQERYFHNNEYLRDYIKNDYYPNSREFTARHVAHIADKMNRPFIDKYDRY